MIICGNAKVLARDNIWNNLLNHYNHDCYDKKTLCVDLTKEIELDMSGTLSNDFCISVTVINPLDKLL